MTKVIRAYRDQLRQVATLLDAYREFYKQPADHQGVKAFLQERFARAETVIFLALVDDEPVGFVQLYPSYDTITLKQIWILHDLFVIPSARQKGIAKSLLERARRLAEETHAKGLILETAVSNDAAQKLYEKLGWKRESDYYRYYLHL